MSIHRRQFLLAAAPALLSLAGCGARRLPPCPVVESDFRPVKQFEPRVVLETGPPAGPAIVLLHELPGMSPADMSLARCLAGEGFTVYLPLLFGERGQDSGLAGYFQSCARHDFECGRLATRSPALDWLEGVCDGVAKRAGRSIAVIGMCLTGVFPLALLRPGVAAAVLCQPTLPFNLFLRRPAGAQKTDLGLAPADLARARESRVPVLGLRYASDTLCPPERMQRLREVFGERFADIEVAGEDGHSTLAESFHPGAFKDTVAYLKVCLGAAPGPATMDLARLSGRRCEMTDRGWRAVPGA